MWMRGVGRAVGSGMERLGEMHMESCRGGVGVEGPGRGEDLTRTGESAEESVG